MTTVLVIEDEERISTFIARGLEAAGFTAAVAGTAAEGLILAMAADVGLIVLDIGLPDRDGFELLRELRARGVSVPVIVLTARSSVDDRVTGLEGGADDYMAKPFHFAELLARIRLRLRGPASEGEATVLRCGGLSLDLRSRQAEVDGRRLDLSAREFALAETFMRAPGRVLSREQLLDRVWGYDHDPGSNVVDVYVGYLRRKLGADRLETVRGMGYRLRPTP
ncbi:MAG: response regulator transcription factor [Bifidobacteriaceae bacterium]|nr:response regulator transcription factor [Bifidobacteriaceae bacterium]